MPRAQEQTQQKSTTRQKVIPIIVIIILLFGIIMLGKYLQKKPTEKVPEPPVKNVQLFTVGKIPKVTFQAKVEKTGVVKIAAQSPGIVQKVFVQEGQLVRKGQSLLSLSSNYQGGNAPAIQRQIAQTQYQNTLDSYDDQKDAIAKQRDIANTNYENVQIQTDIAKQSGNATNALLSAARGVLGAVSSGLQSLQSNNVPGTQSQQFQQLSSSFTNAQNNYDQAQKEQQDLQNRARDNQLKLAGLQRDLTQKQLNVQSRALDLQKEVSRLQVALASVAEANMYPATPFAGIVERIYVKQGQALSPGTPIAVVSSPNTKAVAVLSVPERIAKIIVQGEPSELMIENQTISVTPYYVSFEATDGLLHSVFYDIPETYQRFVADTEYVSISVPVDVTQDSLQNRPTDPLVPIDAVYQTQDSAFVLLATAGKAVSRKVTLGSVVGDYVDVTQGIQPGDRIILDRNVVEGDKVRVN